MNCGNRIILLENFLQLDTGETMLSLSDIKIPSKITKKKKPYHPSQPFNYKTKRKSCQIGKDFTFEDDQLILQLVSEHGPKFKRFTKYFQRKSVSMLKNRYYKKLRFYNQDSKQEHCQSLQIEKEDLTGSLMSLNLFPECSNIMNQFIDSLQLVGNLGYNEDINGIPDEIESSNE